jgi:hypothetical protein
MSSSEESGMASFCGSYYSRNLLTFNVLTLPVDEKTLPLSGG